MSTAGVPLWSKTAASNANSDPSVNMAEGMAPSAVNDGVRALMASVAKLRDDLYGLTTAGSSTAYTVVTNSTFASASDMSGVVFTLIPHATSGAAPTLAVDGLTARAINESTGLAIATGSLIAGTPYLVKYVHATTEFILVGRTTVFNSLTTTGTLTQSTTGQEILPVGTTAQRPSDAAGGFRFNSTTGFPEFNAGTGWTPLLATLAGAQTPYGAVINGTIAESHTGNAATFALKTLAGTDPSATDPVLIAFRNATVGTGNYVYRTVTGALSLTISSGSTFGASNGTAFKVWIMLFDDAGTIRIGAINCLSGTSIYPLGQVPLASSTAEGGLGAADSAQVFYTGTAVTSKPYVILGYVSYESGLTTAGSWDAAPTRAQLFGSGVPLPGAVVQSVITSNSTLAADLGTIARDNSKPQDSEGFELMTRAITPTMASNILEVEAQAFLSSATSNSILIMAVFNGLTSDALATVSHGIATGTHEAVLRVEFATLSGSTSSITFKTRAGANTGSGAQTTFNGVSAGNLYNGTTNSFMRVTERMT